ncbi:MULTISPECIES: hypothetical protein [Caballeronia]|uniref:Uncharacterized protein n=1 Tax=Caballeronia novacaledonica TaxID=1544861 RepID=A0AA37MQ44_9BURK|nr:MULTISPECIES: hypothetical protein [Caballeronia]MDR5743589.1 hypothetical protein [Caballeronia sp. LZ029]GJH25861.1 hypothetical protein CBA19CS42_15115 [Caballeronia novacaledonica]
MSTLTIVDLHREEELSRTEMAHVVGGRDVDKEKALVEAYRVINSINTLENTPDPAPAHVGMRL